MSAEVLGLAGLFSDNRRFRIPWFQRAYAWETLNAGRLLTDIAGAMRAEAPPPRYHLGTVRLALTDEQDTFAIVDGHQRIMTLMILCAVLRDLVDDAALEAQLSRMLLVEATAGAPAHLRLTPQPVIAATFRSLVAGTPEMSFDDDTLCESERNAIENKAYFRTQLTADAWTRGEIGALARFLADGCQVVCEVWQDESAAWRFFQLDEETRLPFDASSRAKASLLEAFPSHERSEASLIWQEIEALVGAEKMFELLGHIRTLRLRRRSEAPLELDLNRAFSLDQGGLSFLRETVLPQAYRLDALDKHQAGGRPVSPRCSRSLRRLHLLDRMSWVPAALLWIETRGSGDQQSELFFQRLERLVWCLRIAGTDVPTKENRIIRLLAEIEAGIAVEAMKELAINDKVLAAVLAGLRSSTFRDKHYAVPVMRLLSELNGGDSGPVDGVRVTVEHILPQSPGKQAGWLQRLTKRKLKPHINRLGNLTFLSQADNQRAGALSWDEKRRILARSGFVLSEIAAREPVWSVETIDRRTETSIAQLMREWNIDA